MKVKLVKSLDDGVVFSKKLLYDFCNKETVLFLSGGSTPKPLYQKLALERKLKIGALAMVDDRYSLHEQYSNEFMIRESGLVQYIEKLGGVFFPVLEYGLSLPKTAEKYDNTVSFLLDKFPKRIAILGIGTDGHIASLPPESSKIKVQNLEFVSFTHSFPTEPKVPRITLTTKTLSLMDLLIILTFGKEKRDGIKTAIKVFFGGKISKKTILITDQKI